MNCDNFFIWFLWEVYPFISPFWEKLSNHRKRIKIYREENEVGKVWLAVCILRLYGFYVISFLYSSETYRLTVRHHFTLSSRGWLCLAVSIPHCRWLVSLSFILIKGSYREESRSGKVWLSEYILVYRLRWNSPSVQRCSITMVHCPPHSDPPLNSTTYCVSKINLIVGR